jgi:hypothetical protein
VVTATETPTSSPSWAALMRKLNEDERQIEQALRLEREFLLEWSKKEEERLTEKVDKSAIIEVREVKPCPPTLRRTDHYHVRKVWLAPLYLAWGLQMLCTLSWYLIVRSWTEARDSSSLLIRATVALWKLSAIFWVLGTGFLVAEFRRSFEKLGDDGGDV